MTREEFLTKLKKTGPWRLTINLGLLRTVGTVSHCPISAVTGDYGHYENCSRAAYALNMEIREVVEIIRAADNVWDADQELRKEMIEACGLEYPNDR